MPKAPTGAKSRANGFVVLLSPGRRCWHCERVLSPYPSAVVLERAFSGEVCKHLFLTCSQYCASRLDKELGDSGVKSYRASFSKVASLLSRVQSNLVAVIESWRCDYHYGAMVYRGVPAQERIATFFAERN